MSVRYDRIMQWYRTFDYLGYNAANNDSDRDGLPNSADDNDGDGVDCRGAQFLAFKYGWAPQGAPFPLLNTSGLAGWAQQHGRWVPWGQMILGDLMLHSNKGNVFDSGGPDGHVEMYGGTYGGRWRGWGSSSSGRGVGYVDRDQQWWARGNPHGAIRIPGLWDGAPAPGPTFPTGFVQALQHALHSIVGFGHVTRGPDVGWVQQFLRSKGFAVPGAVDPNPASAVFGPKCDLSVKNYQGAVNRYLKLDPAHALKVDGIVGPATWFFLAK